MKLRPAIAAATALAMSSCVSPTSQTNRAQSASDSAQSIVVPNFMRHPSSETNLLEQIMAADDTSTLGKVEADHSILQFQARMHKLFDLVRSSPNEMFAEMRREQGMFVIPGATGKVLDPDQLKNPVAAIMNRSVSKTMTVPSIYVPARYEDVVEVMHKNSIFTVAAYASPIDDLIGTDFMLARDDQAANEEKPDMIRSLDGRAQEQKIRSIVAHLTQEAIRLGDHNGDIDIVKSVTRAVPLGLNDEYFGLPGPSREAMARWSRTSQMAIFYNQWSDSKIISESRQTGVEMRDYLNNTLIPSRLQELKNGRPANDVISRVLSLSELHAHYGVSSDRIVANIMGLLVGSVETTSAAVAQSLSIILADPSLRARAIQAAEADDSAMIAKIVWEALRFRVVNHWVARYAVDNYVVAHGTDHETFIPKGSLVLASTESAMFDDSVFPDPQNFSTDRDPSKYLHFGFEYHRCLGREVAANMVPEMVHQLLKLKDVHVTQPMGETNPFPEEFHLGYARATSATPVSSAVPSLQEWMQYFTLSEFLGAEFWQSDQRQAIASAMKAVVAGDITSRSSALSKLPDLIDDATKNLTPQQRVDGCERRNPRMQTLFSNAALVHSFCQSEPKFLSCFGVHRFLANESNYTSYYACAYGQNDLTPAQRADFKQKFGGSDGFYFLNLEQVANQNVR